MSRALASRNPSTSLSTHASQLRARLRFDLELLKYNTPYLHTCAAITSPMPRPPGIHSTYYHIGVLDVIMRWSEGTMTLGLEPATPMGSRASDGWT